LTTFCMLLLASLVEAARDYYKILDVDRSASERDIKRAYRKKAQKLHPDKHPDKESEFIDVSDAYQTLSDPELRKVYDRFGEDAVKRHQAGQGQGGQDPFDLFSSWFGGGGFGGGQQVRKGPSKQFNVQVSLADFYKGKKFEIEHERQVICMSCDGSGARSKADIHQCETCGGRGIRIVRQQIMPGFVTNAQMQCDVCGGRGNVIKHKCPKCDGAKVQMDKVPISVELEPGAPEGHQIVFEGESDEGPDFEAGDVIVKLSSVRGHSTFRRRDANLYLTHSIGLDDALLGFEQNITHLVDSRVITLKRSSVTQPGYVQTIQNEGMPLWDARIKSPVAEGKNGDLFVEYEVVLPQNVQGDFK
ncbi:chaperone J-domain-containing protein, partial [Tilletiaria anomala UBC 951]